MKLRKLEMKDAPLMLEWMHDKNVTEKLSANFAAKSIDDCNDFIKASISEKQNLHMAIVDDNDEYMGTVSLKHITDKDAEFAITIRRVAMGKGYSSEGMKQIIKIGIEELNLKRVYWCVDESNIRAVKFYNKQGYALANNISQEALERYNNNSSLLWYAVDAV